MFPANVTVFFHNFVETNLSVFFLFLLRIPLARETIFGPAMNEIEKGVGEMETGKKRGRGGDRVSLALGTRRNGRLCSIDAVDNRNRTESICCSRADCAYAVCAHTLRGSKARIQKAGKGGSTVRAAVRCESSQPKYSQHLCIGYSPNFQRLRTAERGGDATRRN